MSSDKLPESDADGIQGAVRHLNVNGQRNDQNEKPNAGKPSRQIPTREDCMRALAQLPGYVAMKILTPAQANAIRASYETLLKEYAKSHNSPTGQLSNEDVLHMFRTNPEMLSILEPLLTQDQIDMIVQVTEKK